MHVNKFWFRSILCYRPNCFHSPFPVPFKIVLIRGLVTVTIFLERFLVGFYRDAFLTNIWQQCSAATLSIGVALVVRGYAIALRAIS